MKHLLIIISTTLLVLFNACRDDNTVIEENVEEEIIDMSDYPDWDDATHSKNAELNYSTVFDQSGVLRFDIQINADNWKIMEDDLTANLGNTGVRPPGGMGGGGPIGGEESTFDPVWVPCSFNFNSTEWYNVGIRYKGNSSLRSAYQSGIKKLSFKLDFDEFEDDYPELKNQRFYGFKQLNLNNNFDDGSLLREKVVADFFRAFGLISSQTAFCELYVDNGSGPQFYGLYTIVEEMDDTVLDSQLSDGSGNIYKPEGEAAAFSSGTYNESEMEKKNNEDIADYSDVKALYDIINDPVRTTNPGEWKNQLESIFNVDVFLKWLAANTIMQNWDTYGRMTHNYYLYNNPENNLLTWIPWDNNEARQEGKQGGALSLGMDEVRDNWPLIRYLIDDTDYKNIYMEYLQEFINEIFIPSEVQASYENYYNMLKEYAYKEESPYTFLFGDSDFDNSIEVIKSHVQSRNDAVNMFLNN